MDSLMDVAGQLLRFFIIYLIVFLVLAYGLGWGDLIGNDWVDASSVVDVLRAVPYSFLYLVRDVLPFWWSVVLFGALALSVLTLGIRWLIGQWG